MAARESITGLLEKLSAEFKREYELDEDGFLTLDWGGVRPVTLYAPDEGTAFTLSSSLMTIPPDKPAEAILRWLLERNLTEAGAGGGVFGLVEDDVFLSRRVPVAAAGGVEELKREFSDFMRRAAGLDGELDEFVMGLSETPRAAGPAASAPSARAADTQALSPEELLKANLRQQNMRF